MTAKYFAILTNYGAAQLANAVALGTQMNISAMAVGDGGGTLPVPDPAQTKLIRENRRAAVNQVSVDDKNPNIIIAEQVIPENEGGWWIREIGLYDDKGGLIAIGNAPETYKPNLQEGSGRTQVLQMALIVSSTQAITLKVDPSVVLATREYVTKSIDAAIQASEAKAAKIYATKTELSSGLSGKQPTGDYATRTELSNGLSGKQPTGDYATKTEVNSKLAKDQNGADIPDKPKFIENLGLGEAAKSNVVQEAGESKTDVLSQFAATLLTNQRAPKDGDGINAASFRSNLGLGSVATRSVGLSAGDVPEMSYFSASLGVNGWFKIPVIINGSPATLIYQYGTKSCADRTVTNIDFPIPFPKNCFIFSSCAYQATGGVMVSATVHGADLVHGEASAFFNGEPAAAGYVQFKWYAIGLA
ncbi:phage tail protein [Morganella morganii]